MRPSQPLPLSSEWQDTDAFVDSLLQFVSSTDLFRNLCGGVHILDFLTREPDLYTWVLPQEWRAWFEVVDVHDLLDLLLREDLSLIQRLAHRPDDSSSERSACPLSMWRGYPPPPVSLVDYIRTVRLHCFDRTFTSVSRDVERLPRHIAVGMKPKKIHECSNFAAYVDALCGTVADGIIRPDALSVIDFGSGQNYLGRTLACPPYNKRVVAIEQRQHNVDGAKWMDVLARLAKKEKIMRNKKEYKRQLLALGSGVTTPSSDEMNGEQQVNDRMPDPSPTPVIRTAAKNEDETPVDLNKGSITYVEHALEDGRLEHVLYPSSNEDRSDSHIQYRDRPRSVVVSIHSCGNLTHHGLRSLVLNPSVTAVAMIGCCYNLLTERLGPATYKLPQLRPNHPRLEATSTAFDPHGFPMSQRLEQFEYDVNGPYASPEDGVTRREKGVRLNITARMMAVQAPYNWGKQDSEAFFTRHFYRALLQRILLDLGVVKQALRSAHVVTSGNSLSGKDEQCTPLIIGTLPKAVFTSFPNYVRAALAKLWADPRDGSRIRDLTSRLIETDDRNEADSGVALIRAYETKYAYARKNLSIIWSLMAFSAGVVETAIVTDRWLWLKEQPEVRDAWVETVFDYAQSPRNLVVVGIKGDRPG